MVTFATRTSDRTIPAYCPRCMHWASTHNSEGCMYRGCQCPVGQDVIMGGRVG